MPAGVKTTDFHLGAAVYSSDGTHVGELLGTLVDETSLGLKAVVVKEDGRFSGHFLSPGSMLLTDELVVPLAAIGSVSHDRVDLKLTASRLRKLPPYLTHRFATPTPSEEVGEALDVLTATMAAPRIEETADKPASELEIDSGENVMLGRTGKKLGHVKDILFDGDELVGVVMLPEGLLREEVVLPRRFIGRSDDLALFAQLEPDDLEHLKPFQANG
jgi:sporulation protein YlmC with PRC-barrel domain